MGSVNRILVPMPDNIKELSKIGNKLIEIVRVNLTSLRRFDSDIHCHFGELAQWVERLPAKQELETPDSFAFFSIFMGSWWNGRHACLRSKTLEVRLLPSLHMEVCMQFLVSLGKAYQILPGMKKHEWYLIAIN